MPEEMMPIEALSSGAIGVWTAIIIAWLRERRFLSGKNADTTKVLTLGASYISMFVTAVGIHWTVSGDALVGGSLTIQWPDLNHVLEGIVLFATNLSGQKGYAMMYKVSGALSTLAKAATPPDPNDAKRKALEAQLAELESPQL